MSRVVGLVALLGAVILLATPASASELHYYITVTKAGSGTGYVGGKPVAPPAKRIDCGNTCRGSYPVGEDDDLTATPDPGSTFVGWSGDCSGSGTCTLNGGELAERNVTATFDSSGPYELTVNRGGSGAGSVSGSGISCPSTCSASIPKDATVTLTASASPGSTFTGWTSGPCSGTGQCTFTMDGPKSVDASFDVPAVPTRALTVSRTGTGDGTVTGNGISCGTACSSSYPQGTSVTLTPAPAGGSSFTGWAGACTGTGSCTVTMNTDAAVSAIFDLDSGPPTLPPPPPNAVTLTIQKVGSGSGYVGGTGGIDCGPTCAAKLAPGVSIALVATPAPGSTFAGWNGACAAAPACTFAVDSSQTLQVVFNKARDTTKPAARVFTVKAHRGSVTTLRFRIDDGGGGTQNVTGFILRRSTMIARLGPHVVSNHKLGAFSWRVPARASAPLRFCVRAHDHAGNRSSLTCAALTLR